MTVEIDHRTLLPCAPFEHAQRAVNEWRGRCANALARAESAVTDCLVAMTGVPGRGVTVAGLHLVGQRFDALAKAVAADGPFGEEGEKVRGLLEQFRVYNELRIMLCHGVGQVSLSQHGRWTLILRNSTLRSGKVEVQTNVYCEREAIELCQFLVRDSHALCSHLGNLIRSLTPLPH